MIYTINEAKKALRLLLKKDVVQHTTPFIWGPPGVGKSALVHQLGQEFGPDYLMIDWRLSQIDNVDLRGIPHIQSMKVDNKDYNILKWIVPEDLPSQDNPLFFNTRGILFLDEINRGRTETMQSSFQLVGDRKIGGHKILDSWFIIAAGNLGYEDDTDVSELDSAFKNRFAQFEINCNVDEWILWAKANNIHKDIILYISTHPASLYSRAKEKAPTGRVDLITPRSWEKFSNLLNQNPEVDAKEITVSMGDSLIGGLTGHFNSFLDEKNAIAPSSILFDIDSVIKKIKQMQRDQIQSINKEVTVYISKNSETWSEDKTEKAIENFQKYMSLLEQDLQVAFYRATWNECTEAKSTFMKKHLVAYPSSSDLIISVLDNVRSKKRV